MLTRNLLLMALFLVVGVSIFLHAEEAIETHWKAGVVRADITPQEPLWLAGYASRNHPAEGMLHSLWVKALALEDASGNRSLLITADILGFPKDLADPICERIEQEYQLDRAQIILSASHTHSAPVIGNSLRCMYTYSDEEAVKIMEYAASLEDRVVQLAGEAFGNLQPAALFSGNGIARIAVNRRNNKEGDLLPTSTLSGPQDHAVPTLKITDADGKIRAILFGYACHATVLSDYVWCGDYPGFAQVTLETTYPEATALFFAGCGADQNPMPRRSAGLAKQHGQTLASAVERVINEPMQALEASLITAYSEVELALEQAPDAATLKERIANTGGYEHHCNQWLLDKLERGETLPVTYPYPVQLWQLGAQTLVTLGGEVTVPYAIGIKERLGQDTFVMGYANDLMAYIPSEIILEEGGYEGQTSQLIYGMPNKWKPGLEAQILEAVAGLHREISSR
jgi:neutral ceramidase